MAIIKNYNMFDHSLQTIINHIGIEKLYSDVVFNIYYLKINNKTNEDIKISYVINNDIFNIKLTTDNFKPVCQLAIIELAEHELYEVCKMAQEILNN